MYIHIHVNVCVICRVDMHMYIFVLMDSVFFLCCPSLFIMLVCLWFLFMLERSVFDAGRPSVCKTRFFLCCRVFFLLLWAMGFFLYAIGGWFLRC